MPIKIQTGSLNCVLSYYMAKVLKPYDVTLCLSLCIVGSFGGHSIVYTLAQLHEHDLSSPLSLSGVKIKLKPGS